MKNFIVPIALLFVVSCAERNIATTSESEILNKGDAIITSQSHNQLDSAWQIGDRKNTIKPDTLKPTEEELKAYARYRMNESRIRMHEMVRIINEKSIGRTNSERKLLKDSVYKAFGFGKIAKKGDKHKKILEGDNLSGED